MTATWPNAKTICQDNTAAMANFRHMTAAKKGDPT